MLVEGCLPKLVGLFAKWFFHPLILFLRSVLFAKLHSSVFGWIGRMSYVGRHLNQCRAVPFDWNDAWLVVVSGDETSFCGHALLRSGRHLFHIAGLHARPYYMSSNDYRHYLDVSAEFSCLIPKVPSASLRR